MIQLNHPEPLSAQGRCRDVAPGLPRAMSQDARDPKWGPHGHPYRADDSGKESELLQRHVRGTPTVSSRRGAPRLRVLVCGLDPGP